MDGERTGVCDDKDERETVNSVHITVEAYVKQQDFVTNKYCKDFDPIDKFIIYHQEYAKQIIYDILIFTLENEHNYIIKLIQLSNNYNYQCNSEIINLAPKNLKLLQAILKYHIKKKNLYNAISKFRAKTNCYDMVLSLFVYINNNFKMRIVRQALIKYETQATYKWIFQYMLESVNNVSPKVIFTDSDPTAITVICVIYYIAFVMYLSYC
ncbi:hypothetical protein RhiirA4_461813 [Rhizophagus irregularis]|uniref:MULE transposase domain-containing protein n=1 Tax=Rhizophagus irregularis TaxID=588596 RepID=A0A2I1GJL8_9GLOM|nr:hypothetical protein RhiirA4_461813 [Rhizophagus irregularis]